MMAIISLVWPGVKVKPLSSLVGVASFDAIVLVADDVCDKGWEGRFGGLGEEG